MSALLAIVDWSGAPVDLATARAAVRASDPGRAVAGAGSAPWLGDGVALGRLDAHDAARGIAFTGMGRLDNGDEVAAALGIAAAERRTLDDVALLWRGYLAWGSDAPARLLGDWSFVAWHTAERRLVAARDHLGVSALYYAVTPHGIACATSIRALRAIPGVDEGLDEPRLAAMLLFRRPPDDATFFCGIRRLPGAQVLDATPRHVTTRCYWRLEEVPPVRLRAEREYAEALGAALDASVRCRLRGDRPVGVLLSAGLDSGAIAALAGRALRSTGRELSTYTWAPAFAQSSPLAGRRTDEWPLALETARFAGATRTRRIDAAGVDPITAMAHMVAVHGAPVMPPLNAPWVGESLRLAAEDGTGVLLEGVGGNATVSWHGSGPLRWRVEARARGWLRGTAHHVLRRLLPDAVIADWQGRRRAVRSPSPIAEAFARRVDADALGDLADSRVGASDPRHGILRDSHATAGTGLAALSLASGVSIRVPALDVRVVELCLGIPDDVYTGRGRGRRWLIREAMRGLLPDRVRLDETRGMQGADLLARLRAHAEPITAALDDADRSPLVREYVDVRRMRAAWEFVREGPGAEPWSAASAVLLRGLHAAIFLRDEVEVPVRTLASGRLASPAPDR